MVRRATAAVGFGLVVACGGSEPERGASVPPAVVPVVYAEIAPAVYMPWAEECVRVRPAG